MLIDRAVPIRVITEELHNGTNDGSQIDHWSFTVEAVFDEIGLPAPR